MGKAMRPLNGPICPSPRIVNFTLHLLSRPDVAHLPTNFTSIGTKYDDKVLPSIGNEVSALVRDALIRHARDFHIVVDNVAITNLSYGFEFSSAVEKKQVAQQEAERSKFL
ncbi:prohibitin-3, mitochondrial-like [Musa acuminata AAA Group]|uniref:prohibitin-3, mitochondrial-like n=1 Tax=Musa acuminata AAA Group TaxID=214697 RepID=UPI0031CEE8F0